jgi:hypothetical protein
MHLVGKSQWWGAFLPVRHFGSSLRSRPRRLGEEPRAGSEKAGPSVPNSG